MANERRGSGRWYRFGLRAFLIAVVLIGIGLPLLRDGLMKLATPRPLLRASYIPRPATTEFIIRAKALRMPVTEIKKQFPNIVNAEEASLTNAGGSSLVAVHGTAPLEELLSQLLRDRRARLLAEPTLFTASGCPVSYSAADRESAAGKFRELLNPDSGLRIDFIPIGSRNEKIRLEIRSAVDTPTKAWSDVAVELQSGERLLVFWTSKESQDGLIVDATIDVLTK